MGLTIQVRITGIEDGSLFIDQSERPISADLRFRGKRVTGSATYSHVHNPCPFLYGEEYALEVNEGGCILLSGDGTVRNGAFVHELEWS